MDDDNEDGLIMCQNCEGRFFPEDMDGEHCRPCVEQLFGDDE